MGSTLNLPGQMTRRKNTSENAPIPRKYFLQTSIKITIAKYIISFASYFLPMLASKCPVNYFHAGHHASLLLLVNEVLTSYVLFVTNFAAIGLDKFAEYVVATSKYTKSVTASNNRTGSRTHPTTFFR